MILNDEPRRFSKQVAIKATNDEEMTATGVVLTPYELDRQLDWLGPDGIEAMYNPAPDDGVMHAAFPDDHAELELNEVLDEPREIDGVQFEAGDWVIRRRYLDEQRYELVSNDVLSAYSIGGEVTSAVEYDSVDDLPDEVDTSKVDPGAIPDKYRPPTKIENGAVDEISDVDVGAVPSADMAVVKSIGKSILDETAGRDEFVELMQQRGTDEGDAEQLYDYMTEQRNKMGSDTGTSATAGATDDPISDVDDATLGKRFRDFLGKALNGSSTTDDGATEVTAPEVPASAAKAVSTVLRKEGRTLNEQNREALMAAHDAIEASLASELDFETNRFTDDDSTDFDIAQYGDDKPDGYDGDKAAVAKLTDEQGDLALEAVQRFIDAQGDAPLETFRDWLWSTDALDEDSTFAAEEAVWEYEEAVRAEMESTPVSEGLVDWIQADTETTTEVTMTDDTLTEKIDELEKELEDVKEQLDKDGGDGTGDGAGDGDGDGGVDKDARIAELEEKVDKLSKQTAGSKQLGGSDTEEATTGGREARDKAWTR